MITLSKVKKYILIVIALFVITDGALFIYWGKLAKNDIREPEKITEMKEYSNPFYSFKYPIDYKLDVVSVHTEHKKNAVGQDVYGFGYIFLYKDMKYVPGGVFHIYVDSSPVALSMWGGNLSEVLESIKDSQELNNTNGKIEIAKIAGKDAVRISEYTTRDEGNIANDSVIIPTENYVYEISMSWFAPPGNDSDEEQAEFEEILKSFTILQ